jgi:hypothetical protein
MGNRLGGGRKISGVGSPDPGARVSADGGKQLPDRMAPAPLVVGECWPPRKVAAVPIPLEVTDLRRINRVVRR